MRKAFTLTELIIVMAIIAMLLTLGTVNLLGSQRRTTINSNLTTLLSDFREQRLKAMTGDTEGTGIISSYGIYFGTNSYTLFRGSTYVATSSSNFVVNLGETSTFTDVTLPGRLVVFTDGSGEVPGWSALTDTVSLTDSDAGITRIITINKYGVPISVN